MLQVLDIPNYILIQDNQIYYHSLCRYLRTLYGSIKRLIKKQNDQESLPFQATTQSSNTFYENSIFNTKHTEFSQSGKNFFTTLILLTTTPAIPANNRIPSSNSANFNPHISLSYLFTKPSL